MRCPASSRRERRQRGRPGVYNYTLGKDRDEVPRLQQKRKKTKRKARATYSMMIREKRPSKGGRRRGVKPARLGLKNVGIPPPTSA